MKIKFKLHTRYLKYLKLKLKTKQVKKVVVYLEWLCNSKKNFTN